jgi:hypothetical protein
MRVRDGSARPKHLAADLGVRGRRGLRHQVIRLRRSPQRQKGIFTIFRYKQPTLLCWGRVPRIQTENYCRHRRHRTSAPKILLGRRAEALTKFLVLITVRILPRIRAYLSYRGGGDQMPLLRYFGFAGSALVLLLFGLSWFVPQPVGSLSAPE